MSILENISFYTFNDLDDHCRFPLLPLDSTIEDTTAKQQCTDPVGYFFEPYTSIFIVLVIIWSFLLGFLSWKRSQLLQANSTINTNNYSERLSFYRKNMACSIVIIFIFMFDPRGIYGRIPLWRFHIWVSFGIVLSVFMDQLRFIAWSWIRLIANDGVFSVKELMKLNKMLKFTSLAYFILNMGLRTVTVFTEKELYASLAVLGTFESITTAALIAAISDVCGVYVIYRLCSSYNDPNYITPHTGGVGRLIRPIIIRLFILSGALVAGIIRSVDIIITFSSVKNLYLKPTVNTAPVRFLLSTFSYELLYLAILSGALYGFWFVVDGKKSSRSGGKNVNGTTQGSGRKLRKPRNLMNAVRSPEELDDINLSKITPI